MEAQKGRRNTKMAIPKKEADPKMVKQVCDDADSLTWATQGNDKRNPKIPLKQKVESLDALIDNVLDLYQELDPEKQPWMFPSLKRWVHGHKRPDGTWSRGYWEDGETEYDRFNPEDTYPCFCLC